MIVDPAISALRSDSASQRRLRVEMDAAQAAWRKNPGVAAVLNDLANFAGGQALESLPDLADLMTKQRRACAFVDNWLTGFVKVLQCSSLAQIPMQHHHTEGLTTLQMASANGVALSLSVYAEHNRSIVAKSAVFADREMHDLVLYGAGEAAIHNLRDIDGSLTIDTTPVSLTAGSRISSIGDRQTRQYERVAGRMVVLQLSRVPQRPGITREYALKTGSLLLQSSGDKRASQQEMAMAVLLAMGRSDAAPVLAEIANTDGADHLRWEAVRHGLALNFRVGFSALSQIARSASDPLFAPATQLLAQLHAAYPELTDKEAA